MKTQFDTFENYLLTIGIIKVEKDYTYTTEQLYSNVDFFKKCYIDGMNAGKALEMLHFHIKSQNEN